MKLILPLVTSALLLLATSVQAQDTASRKAQPAPVPVKNVATNGGRTGDTNPVVNKIAVSDPGMPPEKPTSTSKNAATKPKERKKRGHDGVSPR